MPNPKDGFERNNEGTNKPKETPRPPKPKGTHPKDAPKK